MTHYGTLLAGRDPVPCPVSRARVRSMVRSDHWRPKSTRAASRASANGYNVENRPVALKGSIYFNCIGMDTLDFKTSKNVEVQFGDFV